ncbi:MAG: hypothetical protein HY917_05570 [Candidatus Diapherotrites archaeon]|nr:hypothetical protein [Candidatus Diapherotrites archaeon]
MESTRARKFSTRAIEIIGSAQASDSLALTGRSTLTGIPATQAATRSLLLQSKLKLSDISFTEVHDCFTIAEIMATEDIGFFKKGAGGPAALEGKTARDGNLPINTSGGLKGKGHPVGATGIAQAIEAFLQLNGEAGSRQLDNPKTGLTHNVGGSGATVVMHAFRKLR